MINYKTIGLVVMTLLAGCADSDLSADENGDGDPTNDCLFYTCDGGGGGGGGGGHPTPPAFVIERDVSAARPPGDLAMGGHWRQTITSANPAGGTPTVVVRDWPTLSRGTATVSVVTSDATSVTVDVTGTRPGPIQLEISNAVAKLTYYEVVDDVVDVRVVLPKTHLPISTTKIYRGEARLFVDVCTTECRYGGDRRLVDASLEETSGSPLVQTAWDTFELPAEPGLYPVTFESTSFPTKSLDIEVVAAVDRIGIERFDGSSAEVALPAKGTLCFFGVRGEDRVMASAWNVTSSALVNTTNYENCFGYEGFAGRTYVFTVTGMGRTQELEVTTAP